MKKNVVKHLAFTLMLSLLTPMVAVPNNSIVIQAAKKTAAPKLNKTKVTLKGLKDSEKLIVLNPVSGATYSWSSTNTKIATVDYKGAITPVAKGTATIKCRIKYPNKTQKLLSCTVKVEIPVTGIKINNADLGDNNAHVIVVGEKYDFNFNYVPAKPSSKAYWFIEDKQFATVNGTGVVTGIKPGITRLKIVAAPNRAGVDKSDIYHAVNISVVDKELKATRVQSVTLASAGELIIKFSDPIDALSVLNPDTKELKDTIRIYQNKTKEPTTVDPGKLTGSLSTDLKTLTITPEKTFSGAYDIRVTSNVRSTENVAAAVYDETLTLIDKTGPSYSGTTLDDSGVISVINFNEPVDISDMQVLDVLIGNSKASSSTESMIKNKSNYVLAKDKKSLKIDLSGILSTEKNQTITVMLSNIKDFAGNYSSPYIMPVNLYTDTTPKPQAKIVSVKRTSYSVLSVQYDRAIRSPGIAMVGGNSIYGQVDIDNNKIVNYALSSSQSSLRGNQTVSIGYWDSYNVPYTDTSADKYTNITVNFDVDNSAPYIVDYRLDPVVVGTTTTYKLNLTFNETVTTNSTSGYLTSTVYTSNGNVLPNTNLYYTLSVNDKVVTVSFTSTQLTTGNYKISIPAGFVKDVFFNSSVAKDITVNQNGAYGTELPAPTSIQQSNTNPSEIIITFANKLDRASAETVANYSIYGATVTKAVLTEQTDTKAVVTLILQTGSIKYDASYPIVLTGIRGYSDNHGPISKYETIIPLKENTAPVAYTAKYKSSNNSIEITFSENIQGTARFNVYQNNTLFNSSSEVSAFISNNTVYIMLSKTPYSPSKLTVAPDTNNVITDVKGNVALVPTMYVQN